MLEVVPDRARPVSVPALESATGLRRGRIEQLLQLLAVDGVVERVDGGWVATGAGYTPSTKTGSSRSAAARPTSCGPTPRAAAA